MEKVEKGFLERLNDFTEQRKRTLEARKKNQPLDAEEDTARKLARVRAVANVELATAREIVRRDGISIKDLDLPEGKKARAEDALGLTSDFVDVSFLELAVQNAKAVANISFTTGLPVGTGFLISSRLLITNNHVIPSPTLARDMVATFEFELDRNAIPKTVTRFEFDPTLCFVTDPDDDLDYTVIGIGRKLSGPRSLSELGFSPLLDNADKHSLGEFVNVIQHPRGRMKQVVLRENQLASRGNRVLHYLADTQDGSSGSPVFNDQWQVVALHHFSGPSLETESPDGDPISLSVNEGVRISSIVAELREKLAEMNPGSRELVKEALQGNGAESVASVRNVDNDTTKDPARDATQNALPAALTWNPTVTVNLNHDKDASTALSNELREFIHALRWAAKTSSEQFSPKDTVRDDLADLRRTVVAMSERLDGIVASTARQQSARVDYLSTIEGIGEKTRLLLKRHNILTFSALADCKASYLKEILESAGRGFRNLNPNTWPQQAALADAGKFEELHDMQLKLKSGS
ncbi:MAG: trypsin-like peptidase domain-containing protein [Planctomyces sp.]